MQDTIIEPQLTAIVVKSGLEPTKAQVILAQFTGYFSMAAEWERRAAAIIVTDVSQKDQIEAARNGRLFLREKRIAIEKSRKELKENALREGKAIDGIAAVLKGLIEPIEADLERKERFAEYQAAARFQAAEAERIAKEAAAAAAFEEAQRQERARLAAENEQLRQQIVAKDRALEEAKAVAVQAVQDLGNAVTGSAEPLTFSQRLAIKKSMAGMQSDSGLIICPHCRKSFKLEK